MVVFTIILEYKNWVVTLNLYMQPHVDATVLHVGASDIVWYVDYSIGLSLQNCDVQLPKNSDGEASPPQSADT